MICIAITTAVVQHGGDRVPVQAGTAWDANDPVVRAYPDLFSSDMKYARRTVPVVEQATAAPGESRGTRRS